VRRRRRYRFDRTSSCVIGMSIFMVHVVGGGERGRLIRRKRVDKNWSYRYGRIASRGSSLVVTVEVLVPGVVRAASFRIGARDGRFVFTCVQ